DEAEIVVVTADDVTFRAVADGTERTHPVDQADDSIEVAAKGGYDTFMLQEIHEQPTAIADTIAERFHHGELHLDGFGLSDDDLREINRVLIVGCGTALHSGLVGRYLIEEWGGVATEADVASEWRYRNGVFDPRTLVLAISQSGETADTLAAMQIAKERGARVVAVTNIMGSAIARAADGVLYTRAGLEIGVAASKTFTAQVALMTLIALHLGAVRGHLAPEEVARIGAELREVPELVQEILDDTALDAQLDMLADRFAHDRFFLYLGRHLGLPICQEGALKLKEISYIPTDAYAAGEMKHGPIALLGEDTPVVAVATDSHVLEKMASNLEEVRARGAHVIAVATAGSTQIEQHAEHVLYVPRTRPELQPILAIVPLQLLAYKITGRLGLDVDRPRNLAKTVTVE
ncbi:MAG: glutamine--fructose-6-phosphate transaminase (isomerizing), partial [Gaiellales bacterium]